MFLAAQDTLLTETKGKGWVFAHPFDFATRQKASVYDIKIRCDLVTPFLHEDRSDICTIRSSVGYQGA